MPRKPAANPHAADLADSLKGNVARELRKRGVKHDAAVEARAGDRTLPGPRSAPQLRLDWLQAAEERRLAKLRVDDAKDEAAKAEKNLENAVEHDGFEDRVHALAKALTDALRVVGASKDAATKAVKKEKDAWELYEPHVEGRIARLG